MPLRYQIMIAIVVLTIGFTAAGLTLLMISYFKSSLEGASLFFVFRVLLGIVLAPLFIPLVISAVFIDKEWKKKKFKWRSVGVYMGFAGEYLVVTVLLVTVCDLLFPSLDFLWQLPLTLSSSSVGLIAMAMTVRRFRNKLDF